MSHPSAPAPGRASTAGERHERFGSAWQITLEHAARGLQRHAPVTPAAGTSA